MTARARAFSGVVTSEDWLTAARTWATERVGDTGQDVIGVIEQVRVRPWSTQLVVPTTEGRWWFKATCDAMMFEAALHQELADLLPEAVDRPAAVDVERGWVLTRDCGSTLGDLREATTADWCRVVEVIADMQRRVESAEDRLLATGLPDCRPSRVLGTFDRLVEVLAELPADHPCHVDAGLRDDLARARPRLADAVDVLAAGRLPITWQHGDAHPWNVFLAGGGPDDTHDLRVFDFGDGQWAHALEVLAVPQGWIESNAGVEWAEVERAYCAVWGLTPADVAEEAAAARRTHPLHRAVTWWKCLGEASAAEWEEWGDAPIYHLRGVLGVD